MVFVDAPLDHYSFPSGHTLHAVSFTVILTTYLPGLAGALVALASLIALSRVILGLHYPTDVAAGAALGGSLGFASVMLGPVWLV
jgi:undecaprenyl-diphosphatase